MIKYFALSLTALPYIWLASAFASSTRPPPTEMTVILSIACCAYHIAFLREARRGFTIPLVTYYFFWIFMSIAPLAYSLTGRWLWGDLTHEYSYEIILGSVYCALFLIVFIVFFKRAQRRPVRGWFSERTELRSGGLGYALILATLIWTYVISRIGVSGLLSRAGAETFFEQGTTELLVICNFWRPLGLFVCTLPVVSMVLFKDANVRPKWLAVALALGGVALNLPISVPRYYAFMTLGVVMFFLFRQRKWRLSPYIGIMFLTLGLFGSFLVNTFRSASSAAELVERFQDIKAIDTDHFYYGDLDAYEMLTYGIAYVEDNQVSWGRGLLGAMLFWVPRSLWSSKPISTGNLLGAEYINLTEATANVNLSAPLVVEGYINFGIFGILGIGISSGWLLGRLSQSSFNADSFVRSDVILAPLMGLWLFVLRGSLMSAFAYTVGIVLAGGLTSFLLFRSKIALRRF